MLYPIYLYLSGSVFLVNSADLNKELPNVKSVFNPIRTREGGSASPPLHPHPTLLLGFFLVSQKLLVV